MANDLQTILETSLYNSMNRIFLHLDRQDIPIVFANEGGLEHKGTYAIINIIKKRRVSRVQESTASPIDEQSLNVYTNYYTLHIQVSFVGSKSSDVMADFEDSVFSSRNCIEFWQINNLGPLSQSDSRRIPQLRETKWIPSYNIDLNLSFSVQSRETIDWIEFFTFSDMYGFDPT